MQNFIRVKSGKTNQGIAITDRLFELLQNPKKDQHGIYIVVDGKLYPDLRSGRTRIYIDSVTDYESVTEEDMNKVTTELNNKTDDEIKEEIEETFDILTEMTKAVAAGSVKGLVVSGPAGIGKSHTVEETLKNELNVLGILKGVQQMYESIHGAMSASVLYEKLWTFKDPCQVLVLDDCDGILYDEDALNVLKSALDSKPIRTIHWNTNSYRLDRKDIPNSFQYRGSIIFITNIDFMHVRSPRIANHLEAIVSRCHYMSLGINTLREKIIHIKNVVYKKEMLEKHGLNDNEIHEVMSYITDNSNRLRETSLRTVLKTADLRKAMPTRWQKFADKNILRVD